MQLKQMYREAWQALIKPERTVFSKASLRPLSLIHSKVAIANFELKNEDGFKLEGTFYYPENVPTNSLDVVMYLHTRGGSRLEGLFLVPVLAQKLGVVLFDFAGSGHSEGEYITLGPKEARDAGAVISHMRSHFGIQRVVIWGRSMGAVAAILYGSKHSDKISGLVLDSPFSCFRKMIYDIVYSRRKVPTCLIDIVMHFVLKTVKRKTGVDMYSIKPIKVVSEVKAPCLYIVSHEDLISRPDKVKDLYLKTGSTCKEFYLTQGEHNSVRSKEAIMKAMYFILRCLPGKPSVVEPVSAGPSFPKPPDDALEGLDDSSDEREQLLPPPVPLAMPLHKPRDFGEAPGQD